MVENGSTATPTSKSATANDTINKFVTDRSFDEQNTAAITKQLPIITITFINARMERDTISLGSPHVVFFSRAAHADESSVFCITSNGFWCYIVVLNGVAYPGRCGPLKD